MRLIDADKLVFKLNNSQIENSEEYKGLGEAKQIVDNMPTVCDIEQIRAEIAALPEDMGNIIDIQTGEIKGKYISSIKVLQIIDKYKAESEE